MIDRVIRAATLASAIGSGMMAALLLTFSIFVMRALGRLPSAQGIAKMQSLNVAILNPLFGLAFMGTTVSCLFLLVTAPSTAHQPASVGRTAGALLFLIGTIAVTFVINVPLNNALAKLNPTSIQAAKYWAHYRAHWTAWNHIRAVAATGAAVTLALAFRSLVRTAH